MLCGIFGIFSQFWYVVPRKIWQPCSWADQSAGSEFDKARLELLK
jgi:hypothetical protein